MTILSTFKKDILEGMRNYKFLIIFAGLLFFALLDPVMNKYILPEILQGQFPGITPEMLNDMIDSTQRGAIRAYLGDIYEIGTIILVFTLCGLVSREIKDKTFIFPICSGRSFGSILLSKIIVYGGFSFIAVIISIVINYYYSSLLFGFDMSSILPIIKAGMLYGLFMIFVISLMILIGTFTKVTMVTGILSLIFIYLTAYLGSIFHLTKYVPSGLLYEAQSLTSIGTKDLYQNIIVVLGLIVIFTVIAIIRLKNLDLTKR